MPGFQATLRRAGVFAAVFLLVLAAGQARPASAANWVGSWAASQMIPDARNALAAEDLHDATLRQIVHLTIGGNEIRVRLSNAFGTQPLHIVSAHVARPLSPSFGSVDVSTDKALTFSGIFDVTIPAGADYVSDPIAFPVAPFSDLAISLYLDAPPAQQTGHPGSHQISFLAHGNQVTAVDLADAKPVEHWYQLSGVDVTAPAHAAAVVALGDSITDGHGATTNGNDRWPDNLARRLWASSATRLLSVVNAGMGGNRLLNDGFGPNTLSRFDRDVLGQAGVRYLIVLEGTNDLGKLTKEHEVSPAEHEALVRRVIGAYEQIILRAHAHGIRVMGATITPFVGSSYYQPTANTEADRQAINDWIRTPGHFDDAIDFDRIVRDPDHPDRLLPLYDSGDQLHPSPAGYRAMANAIPLSFFAAIRNTPPKATRSKAREIPTHPKVTP